MIILQHSYVLGSRMMSVGDNGQGVSYPRANPSKANQIAKNKVSRGVRRARNGLVKNETSEEQLNQQKVVLGSQKTKKTQTNKLANKDKITKNVSPKMDVKSLDDRIEKKQDNLLGKYNHKMAGKPKHTQIGLLYEYVDAVKQAQVELLWQYRDAITHNR